VGVLQGIQRWTILFAGKGRLCLILLASIRDCDFNLLDLLQVVGNTILPEEVRFPVSKQIYFIVFVF
jgi:hypothetical protein